MNEITIIIPTLNEAPGIEPTIKEYQKAFPDAHILVVDGGSTDGTIEIARSLGAEVIQQEGKGKGKAIKTAIEHIKNNKHQPKYVIITDGDYTYPAKPAKTMIKILENHPEIGMVTGDRFHIYGLRSYLTNTFGLGNLILKILHICLNRVRMKDPLTGLRAIKWKLVEKWEPKAKHFEVEVEINNYIKNKAKIVEIPINYRERLGTKKLKVKHGIPIALQIIKNIKISVPKLSKISTKIKTFIKTKAMKPPLPKIEQLQPTIEKDPT